ncbi:MAG: hypothetical protein LBT85_01180 [Bifidobacteriaceae bacterium]|jgi:photosystem II stability/assembly factor-like uncharacterized protein|nr:hypothetical protein [Bifidobacteriaceae bacterium]
MSDFTNLKLKKIKLEKLGALAIFALFTVASFLTGSSVSEAAISKTALPISFGGTGASTQSTALTNLGINNTIDENSSNSTFPSAKTVYDYTKNELEPDTPKSVFIASANNSCHSCFSTSLTSLNNGASWESKSIGNNTLRGIAYGDGTFIMVSVGNLGIFRSTDKGQNWSSLSYTVDLYSITFGNGVFVAVGDSGNIMRSTDLGVTWTSATVGTISRYGVAFRNGVFIAVGDNGNIVRSTDLGTTWTSATVGTISRYGVAFRNGVFIAVGDDGNIMRSTDLGATWTSATVGTKKLRTITYGNNTWIILGFDTVLRSTDNGKTWQQSSLGYNGYGIAYGNKTFIGVGRATNDSYGYIFTSTDDGLSWKLVYSITTNNYNQIYGIATD